MQVTNVAGWDRRLPTDEIRYFAGCLLHNELFDAELPAEKRAILTTAYDIKIDQVPRDPSASLIAQNELRWRWSSGH